MVWMAWASGLFGGNGSGSARGGSDRGSTRPRKALLELLGTGEMDGERERGTDAAGARETESPHVMQKCFGTCGVQAKASGRKQTQAKANEGKQRQTKAG